jgi:hypothetical protein
VVVSPGVWVWRQLCEPLSALFEAAAHLPPPVSWLQLQALFIAVFRAELSHSPNPAGFVYLEFSWKLTPSLSSSVKSCQPVYSCRPCLLRV